MLFNPLAIILKENKLTGPNYVDWKRNRDIVLTIEGYKYILIKECSNLLAANEPKLKIEGYKNR